MSGFERGTQPNSMEIVETMGEPYDPIEKPEHYNFSEIEPFKVIRAWGLNFYLGNVIKYVARANHKDDALTDLKKARRYLDEEIEFLQQSCVDGPFE